MVTTILKYLTLLLSGLIVASLISHKKDKTSNITAQRIVVVNSLLFALLFTLSSIFQQLTVRSHAFDMGIFDQYASNIAQYQIWESSLHYDKHFFAGHFQPTFLVLIPVYRVLPSPFTLLIAQSIALSLTGIVVLQLWELLHPNHKQVGMLLAIGLQWHIILQRAVSNDFHPETFSILFILLSINYLHAKKQFNYWITILLLLGLKENMAIYGVGIGLYALFNKKNTLGIATVILSCLWLYLSIFIIVPHFNAGQPSIFKIDNLPPLEFLTQLLVHPFITLSHVTWISKLHQLFILCLPVGFIGCLHPAGILLGGLAIPLFLFRVMGDQNYVPYLACVIIGTIHSAKYLLGTVRIKYASFICGIGIASFAMYPFSRIFIHDLNTDFQNRIQIHTQLQRFKNDTPSSGFIVAQQDLLPQLTNKFPHLYIYPENLGNADYIILEPQGNTYPLTKQEYLEQTERLTNNHIFTKSQYGALQIFTNKSLTHQ